MKTMTDIQIAQAITLQAAAAHHNAKEKGFWPTDKPWNFGEKIALMHSELSEALEKHRKHLGKGIQDPPDEHCPDFGGVEIEFADTIIRIFDVAIAMGFNIGNAVIAKMEFNATREKQHGKAY